MSDDATPAPSPSFELESIADLRPAKYNPRRISKPAAAGLGLSLESFGDLSGITWNRRTGVLVGGHQRVTQLKSLGAVFLPGPPPRFELEHEGKIHAFAIRVVDLSEADEKAANLAANNPKIAGEFTTDLDALLADVRGSMTEDVFVGLQFDALALDFGTPAPEQTYTRKITLPVYEPKGDRPEVADLFDDTKTRELVAEIEKQELPPEVARFLRLAAERHTVFDFRNIAEFYAHADAKTQALMERSALVLIDFDAAIENGFVRMTERLGQIAETEEFSTDDS